MSIIQRYQKAWKQSVFTAPCTVS